MTRLAALLVALPLLGIPLATSAQEDQQQQQDDIWYEPDFNRYAVDLGWFDEGEQYGYHYEEEDEFGWYDDDFNWQADDPDYEAWYGDADEDWDDDWF